MKRVNIQNDVESRQRIAAASPKPFTERTDERMNPKNEQQDGTSEEVPGCEDHPIAPNEPVSPTKRGRKANGNVQKVSV